MKLILGLLFFATQAHALMMQEHALGESCYFLRQKNSVSLCHPANVAREDDEFF